jgi:hypothetical protein
MMFLQEARVALLMKICATVFKDRVAFWIAETGRLVTFATFALVTTATFALLSSLHWGGCGRPVMFFSFTYCFVFKREFFIFVIAGFSVLDKDSDNSWVYFSERRQLMFY